VKLPNNLRLLVSADGHTIEELKRRVRADKLLFSVSRIATWKFEKLHNGINEKVKCEIMKRML
jgi:hypothetical protein